MELELSSETGTQVIHLVSKAEDQGLGIPQRIVPNSTPEPAALPVSTFAFEAPIVSLSKPPKGWHGPLRIPHNILRQAISHFLKLFDNGIC